MGNNNEENDDLYNVDFYKSLTGEQAVNERIKNGRLPIIDICGHIFFVDVRLNLLRPMNAFHTMGLDLKNGGSIDHRTNEFLFYYHIPSKTEYIPDPNMTALPKDVVLIKFPDVYTLDPIAMARENGYELTAYLQYYRLTMFSMAKVIPLEKTHLAKIVKQNLAKENKINPKVKKIRKGI